MTASNHTDLVVSDVTRFQAIAAANKHPGRYCRCNPTCQNRLTARTPHLPQGSNDTNMSTDLAELPVFNYHPLAAGEIRVLVPNSADGLSWTLKVSGLTDLSFDALSYCWGPQAETFPIRCNDHQLRVHYNLHTALPYLARRQLESTPVSRYGSTQCASTRQMTLRSLFRSTRWIRSTKEPGKCGPGWALPKTRHTCLESCPYFR